MTASDSAIVTDSVTTNDAVTSVQRYVTYSTAATTEGTADITNIVFDFCGVLVDWQCRAALDGRYDPRLVNDICSDEDTFGFFHFEDLMDGGMLLSDVLPLIAQQYGHAIADVFKDYINRYDDALPRSMPGMLELLQDLKSAGYHLFGLTNWSSETIHVMYDKYPEIMNLLDDTIVSGIERLHKPEPAIYELAITRFGIDPARSVFIDDTVKNVEGARRVGFQALHFVNSAQTRMALRTLGVHS
ncbi:haloacid dehalogenase [Bifidobacterium dolichotidis]|uniref:Haloacid dehalogenase n=1 Tax=Bifidobacterium dolichotidis TaxID=2306976 RepID=A0A430FT08_9BIFI|nr:HAD family phosphatase [Bifidobacterium dolichotidis]RSX56008.1 haloacid dehalogenase [Bifidobacterium dolichotidis]